MKWNFIVGAVVVMLFVMPRTVLSGDRDQRTISMQLRSPSLSTLPHQDASDHNDNVVHFHLSDKYMALPAEEESEDDDLQLQEHPFSREASQSKEDAEQEEITATQRSNKEELALSTINTILSMYRVVASSLYVWQSYADKQLFPGEIFVADALSSLGAGVASTGLLINEYCCGKPTKFNDELLLPDDASDTPLTHCQQLKLYYKNNEKRILTVTTFGLNLWGMVVNLAYTLQELDDKPSLPRFVYVFEAMTTLAATATGTVLAVKTYVKNKMRANQTAIV